MSSVRGSYVDSEHSVLYYFSHLQGIAKASDAILGVVERTTEGITISSREPSCEFLAAPATGAKRSASHDSSPVGDTAESSSRAGKRARSEHEVAQEADVSGNLVVRMHRVANALEVAYRNYGVAKADVARSELALLIVKRDAKVLATQ
jgi:hypothetical protein